MEVLPLILLAPLLLAVGYFDLRYMRIPNVLVLLALGLFVATAPLVGWGELGVRALSGLIVFGIGFAMFAFGLLGGGDVKMMAALMLFVPSQSHTEFAFAFSAAMLAGIATILLLRAVPLLRGSSWVSIQRPGTFPMGISIAMAGLVHPFVLAAIA